jgi:hypothetical protein
MKKQIITMKNKSSSYENIIITMKKHKHHNKKHKHHNKKHKHHNENIIITMKKHKHYNENQIINIKT